MARVLGCLLAVVRLGVSPWLQWCVEREVIAQMQPRTGFGPANVAHMRARVISRDSFCLALCKVRWRAHSFATFFAAVCLKEVVFAALVVGHAK